MTYAPRLTGPYDPSMRGTVLAEMAERFEGCSLSARTSDLADLVAGGDDDPGQIVRVKTNCATFVRGLLESVGVYHEVLDKKYVIGQAVADVRRIASRHDALFDFRGQDLPRGTLLHYWTPGRNDSHLEVLLGDVSAETGWVAETIGGGKPDNAVLRSEPYDVRSRAERPLSEVVDPVRLLATTYSQGLDVSRYNPPGRIDYAAARRVGIEWVYIRVASGGTPDTAAGAHYRAAKEAGLHVGPYVHFDPRRTIQEHLAVVPRLGFSWDLPPALDIESWGTILSDATWAAPACGILRALAEEIGSAVRYLNPSDWARIGRPAEMLRYPLWLADYTGAPDLPDWTIWQRGPRRLPGVADSEIDWNVRRIVGP